MIPGDQCLFDRIEQVEKAKKEAKDVFIFNERLPKIVFQEPVKNFVVMEHGYLLMNEFIDIICEICKIYQDDFISYLSLCPPPEYYRNCPGGGYGGFSLDSSVVNDQFHHVMTLDSHAESFEARGGDIACVWGSSKNWGIFIDRITWENFVIGSVTKIPFSVFNQVNILNEARIESYARSQRVPLDKITDFVQNYYAR